MISARVLLVILLGSVACDSRIRSDPVRITVPPGASVATVADTLVARGIIRHPKWFRVLAQLTRRDRSIQAGVYDLSTDLSAGEVLDMLVTGRVALTRVVIPEGLMVGEVAETVSRQLPIGAHTFLTATRDSTLRSRVGARGPTLEGYLYPSTYHVPVDISADALVRIMITEFEKAWRPAWDAVVDSLGWTRDEMVTLASIIEGEVRHDADRAYVSSVYHNRLQRGMRLQADPTVIYALGTRRRLFLRDYQIRSPYNTYRIDGLPPHPIGQPAAASLEAAVYPVTTDFLFFVAGRDGQHVFTRSLREHNAAIARVRSP